MADSERQDALKEADPDVDGRVGQDPFPLGDCTIRSERSCTVGKEQAESEFSGEGSAHGVHTNAHRSGRGQARQRRRSTR